MLATSYPTGIASRPVSAPRRPLPDGAWDTHAHVFGPFDRYPLASARRYQPPLATAEAYRHMCDTVGFRRGVLVHASASGFDNSTTADATAARPGAMRAIGVVPYTAPDAELARMHTQGFRGIRFSENGREPRGTAQIGVQTLDDLPHFAPRLKALGWHAQIWAKCEFVVEMSAAMIALDIPLVFDHMGYYDAALGVDDRVFRSFTAFLSDGPFYIKMTPGRVSKQHPSYADARPFHDALVEAAGERMLFGSDWPFLGNDADPPDVGKMVDLFDEWTPDGALRRKTFVDNPQALYGLSG